MLYAEELQNKNFANQSSLEQTADGSGKLFTVHSDVTQQFLEENVEKSLSLTKTVRGIGYITQCWKPAYISPCGGLY